MAKVVAEEMNWADDWLNDGAKGYLQGISEGRQVFSAPGIEVFMPSAPQLLAMKLMAWRSAKDEMDAARILEEMSTHASDRDKIWKELEMYLIQGYELKAQYAFNQLWEVLYGHN